MVLSIAKKKKQKRLTSSNTKANPASVKEKRVLLKRGTLQVLTGNAGYDFSHAIANSDLLSDRRVSVTMRESPSTVASSSLSLSSIIPSVKDAFQNQKDGKL
jgi:hypothetical protein